MFSSSKIDKKTQSRQKSDAYVRRRNLEFEIDD